MACRPRTSKASFACESTSARGRPSRPFPHPRPCRRAPEQRGDAAQPIDQPPATHSAIAAENAVDRLLARIERHNRANRETVAYKRLVPVLAELGWDDEGERSAVRLCRVIRDMTQGDVQRTGRVLDVAIQGPGFLQVRCGDDVRYTRDGRLTRDSEGRLKLLAAADDWLIEPPIVIPPDATDVTITEDGHVSVAVSQSREPIEVGTLALWSFLNPELLEVDATGLYQQTNDAGASYILPADASSASSLIQHHLEASNAAPTAYRPADSRR